MYRRFGYLHSRLLLDRQDGLRILERRLEEYDRANVSDSHTRALDGSVLLPRQTLLAEIECAFNAYGMHATLTKDYRISAVLTIVDSNASGLGTEVSCGE